MPVDITNPEIQNLISALNKRKAFVIAGAGVSGASIDANSRTMVGTWTNLLRYGIQFCCDKCRTEATWGDSCRTFLDNEHATTEELLKIGDEIWDCLVTHDKVQDWLNIFDDTSVEYRDLLLALKALGVPIATANYDNLLEDITHLTPITLQETQKVEDFIKDTQKQKYILHLHGYYKKPESIVLGQKSYDTIVKNEFAQFINRYIVTAYNAVVFVGFGQGVYDQNFSLIFKWASTYLSKTKLYHLVLDKYVDDTKKIHQKNGNPNVVVLGYGNNYDDLTPSINLLAYNIERPDDLPKTLEGKPTCIGQNRLDLVEDVAQYLSKNYKKPVGILGTGGLGKTNLVLNLLHHKTIDRKYRRNRFFVRCDGAKDLSLLYNTLVNALEMPASSGDLGNRILNYLSHQDSRFLIAFDNFETTWEDKNNVEPFIEKLKDLADLVFTYRGNASPDELDWKAFKVPFLSEDDAITLFHENVEEKKFVGNTLVKTIVKEVDYLPLAIELLAKRAKKVEKLEVLYQEWQRKKNEFISRGDDKNTNLNISIAFSYENTRLSNTNRAFLQALGYLPLGMNRQDLENILDDAYDHIEILKELGLCEETEQNRLWVVAPIREYLKQKTTTDNELVEKVQHFYLDLALSEGVEVGKKGNRESSIILRDEWSNIIKVIDNTITIQKSINALNALCLYCTFTGFYPIDLFKSAIRIAKLNNWNREEATTLFSLGDLFYSESRIQESMKCFSDAIPIFVALNDSLRKASCLFSVGYLKLRNSELFFAKLYFTEAIRIYDELKFYQGRADCLWSLGDLDCLQRRYDSAKLKFQEALSLYDEEKDLLGIANCWRSLGDLSFIQSENQTIAINFYKQALPLYEKIGDLMGKANCLRGLGDLAFIQSEKIIGNQFYEQAFELFKKINNSYAFGRAYYLCSLVDEVRRSEYQCMAKKVLLSAKLDVWVKNWGLTDLECE